MGARMAQRKERPSLILTSTAVRARETARLVADSLNYPREFLQSDRGLYHADPGRILAVVAEQEDSFAHILLVGHNPGLTELAEELIPDFHLANLPTAGIVAVELPIDRWSQIGDADGKLRFFDFPKNPLPVDVPPEP
jgi:phosphohistidine phosphatase